MKRIYTKLIWRNNKYVLQVRHEKNGKFKQFFSSQIKQEVKAKREQLRKASIPFNDPNFFDVRLDELTYCKLMVITKQLNQKSCNKTINDLINKAHADCKLQSA